MFQFPPKTHVASRKDMTLFEEQKLKLQIETRSEEVKVWSGRMATDHEAKKYVQFPYAPWSWYILHLP